MSVRQTAAARRRVTTLLNAIADLQEGDLLAVLELDQITPLIEFGENDMFKLGEDGKIVFMPGWPPAPRSLKNRARTGEDLARILEQHLMSALVLGEVKLMTYQKHNRGKKELGGRRF